MKPTKVIQELTAYMQAVGLSRREMAQALELPVKTVEPWFSSGKKRYWPSAKNVAKIEAFLATVPMELVREAKRRTEKVRWILLLLADELRWFKDSEADAREVLRNRLDPFDTGYIASLLTMLHDEAAFDRWRKLTTNRFRGFTGRGSHGEKGRNPR